MEGIKGFPIVLCGAKDGQIEKPAHGFRLERRFFHGRAPPSARHKEMKQVQKDLRA
jgi:hypothetical protein